MKKRYSSLIASTAIFVTSFSATPYAVATAPTPTEIGIHSSLDASEDLTLRSPMTGDSFSLTSTPTAEALSIRSAACRWASSNSTVKSYSSTRDKKVKLKCGTSGAGFKHIESRHSGDWLRKLGGSGNWSNFMIWATGQSVNAPSRTSTQTGNKRCYTAPIEIYKKGKKVDTFYAEAHVSINNKIVITSFPNKKQRCS